MADRSEGNARTPEFEVFHPREKPSPWTKVGVAFENNDGSLSVLIDYVPTGAGQLRLNLRKPKPKQGAPLGPGFALQGRSRPGSGTSNEQLGGGGPGGVDHDDDDDRRDMAPEPSGGRSSARSARGGRGGR